MRKPKQEPDWDKNEGKFLTRSYSQAGDMFLAYRLMDMFKTIENDEDRVLHNQIVKEISLMVGSQSQEFIKNMARLIINFSMKD